MEGKSPNNKGCRCVVTEFKILISRKHTFCSIFSSVAFVYTQYRVYIFIVSFMNEFMYSFMYSFMNTSDEKINVVDLSITVYLRWCLYLHGHSMFEAT